MQDVMPKTPANAVATVMMTLRTTPHTDFDFVLMLFGFNVKKLVIDNENKTMIKIISESDKTIECVVKAVRQ